MVSPYNAWEHFDTYEPDSFKDGILSGELSKLTNRMFRGLLDPPTLWNLATYFSLGFISLNPLLELDIYISLVS